MYNLEIMRQNACLVFNQIMVEGYSELLSCTVMVKAQRRLLREVFLLDGYIDVIFGRTHRYLTSGFPKLWLTVLVLQPWALFINASYV